jgi:hypothetical protein
VIRFRLKVPDSEYLGTFILYTYPISPWLQKATITQFYGNDPKSLVQIYRDDHQGRTSKLYGPLLLGEVVIKFAEHKNFAAAREEFNTWNQHDIIQTDNLINQNNRLSPQSHNSWEEYIAIPF